MLDVRIVFDSNSPTATEIRVLKALTEALTKTDETTAEPATKATPEAKPVKTPTKATKTTVETIPAEKETTPPTPTTEPAEAKTAPAKSYDVEDIRAMLADLKHAKGLDRVRAILKAHGATTGKLAEVATTEYPAMVKAITAAMEG